MLFIFSCIFLVPVYFLIVFCVLITGIDLKIIPEKTYKLILEGAELKLDCVVKFSGTPNVKAEFYKDGVLLPEGTHNGYHVRTFIILTLFLD